MTYKLPVRIAAPDNLHEYAVDFILSKLSASDQREKSLWGSSPESSKFLATRHDETTLVVWFRDEPVFVFGTVETSPGVRDVWGFGTDRFRRVVPSVTRFIRDRYAPWLFDKLGTRRVQVSVPLVCSAPFNWLTTNVGLRVDAILPSYCADHSPMAILGFTISDYLNVQSQSPGHRHTEDRTGYLED